MLKGKVRPFECGSHPGSSWWEYLTSKGWNRLYSFNLSNHRLSEGKYRMERVPWLVGIHLFQNGPWIHVFSILAIPQHAGSYLWLYGLISPVRPSESEFFHALVKKQLWLHVLQPNAFRYRSCPMESKYNLEIPFLTLILSISTHAPVV